MLRSLLVIAALVFSLPARATCTWTSVGVTAKGVCTTGSETVLGASDGLLLSGGAYNFRGLMVFAESGSTFTSGMLQAYLWNPVSAQWDRFPDWDLSVQPLSAQGFGNIPVVTVVPGTRVAWLPSGVGVGSTIYITPGY